MAMKYTIKQLTEKYRDGTLTPTEYITSQLHRLEHMNPRINAISKQFNKEHILKQAAQSTIRYKNNQTLGPFDGIPITTKNTSSSATKGVQIDKGSMLLYLDKNNTFIGDIPSESVKEIAMLQDSGAIILCQTTVPEMCWKGTTSSLLYGITRNPHNLTKSTGGSSGGAAALTTLGIGCINIGTDGAGSIRIPASHCGVFGYKPSYTIAHSGNNGASFPYLSHTGPITTNMDDIIVYMTRLCQYTNTLTHLDFSDAYIKSGVKGMNIGISKNLDGIVDFVDDNVWKNVLDIAKYLESMGANVEFVEPLLSRTKMNYIECICKLWYISMKKYGKYVEIFNEGKYKHMVDPGLMELMERSKTMKDMDELMDIIQIRDEVKQIMHAFHEKYDILITATCALLPPEALSYVEDGQMKDMISGKMVNVFDCCHSDLAFTSLFNFTHQPALSMPCGYVETENGKMPIGVQIVGALDKDNVVLKVGYCLENKFKYLQAKL